MLTDWFDMSFDLFVNALAKFWHMPRYDTGITLYADDISLQAEPDLKNMLNVVSLWCYKINKLIN